VVGGGGGGGGGCLCTTGGGGGGGGGGGNFLGKGQDWGGILQDHLPQIIGKQEALGEVIEENNPEGGRGGKKLPFQLWKIWVRWGGRIKRFIELWESSQIGHSMQKWSISNKRRIIKRGRVFVVQLGKASQTIPGRPCPRKEGEECLNLQRQLREKIIRGEIKDRWLKREGGGGEKRTA